MKKILLISLAIFCSLEIATAQTGTTYIYDDLNRLTQVTYSNGTTINYTYDALGNRLSKTVTAAVSSQLPTVITANVSQISETNATCGGNVTSDGGNPVYEHGVCWSASHNPTTADAHLSNGTGTGSFTINVTGLSPNTTYYVRAYASNNAGTAYGEEKSFTTTNMSASSLPYTTNFYNDNTWYLNNGTCSNFWAKNAAQGLFVTNDNTTTDYDITSSSTVMAEKLLLMPTCDSIHLEFDVRVGGESNFDYLKVFLAPSSVDYVASTDHNAQSDKSYSTYAVNFSNFKSQTGNTSYPYMFNLTNGNVPIHISLNVENPNANGEAKLVFLWRNDFSLGDQPGAIISSLSVSEINGSVIPPSLPIVVTNNVSNITSSSAICGGNVVSDGGDSVYERGVCWSTSQNPTIAGSHLSNGTGTGSFSINVTGLLPTTTYYVRAYAKNSVGTAYGEEAAFSTTSTSSCGTLTVSDYDGNIYNTVLLGTQCWMKQNMKTTHYSDGTFILLGSGIDNLNGYRYYPNNNSDNVASMGYLYNWAAAMHGSVSSDSVPSGVQGVCPTGWHIPSMAEADTLFYYANSQIPYHCNNDNFTIGKSLASTTGWANSSTICAVGNNPSHNNATQLSCMPAGAFSMKYGAYGITYQYFAVDSMALFWVSSQFDGDHAYDWVLYYDRPDILVYGTPMYNYSVSKSYGLSVRCLKDESEPGTTYSLSTITTDNISNITASSATCGGNVISDGGVFVTAKGVCWSTSPNPTVLDPHTNDGTSTGSFNSSITGLSPNTTYYVRAYAINYAGTSYGNELSFHTTCNQAMDIAGTTNICQGQSTTLTACCGTQYSWNTGEHTASISVSPSQTTTYSVTITDTYGCQSSLSTTIVVNPIPVITCSLPAHLCWNSDPVVLNDYASVTNNPNAQLTFTGYGVSNGIFYPTSTYHDVPTFITVSYQDPTTGCWANTVVDSITTHSSSEITLNYPMRDTICQNELPLLLSGSLPEGGYYSGMFVNSETSIFNPPGNHHGDFPVYYEFTNQYGCYSKALFVIVVIPTTKIYLNADSVMYHNSTYLVFASPNGGILTLDNQPVPHLNNQPDEYPNTYQIVANNYSLGQHELTYSLDDYCHSSLSQQITIISPDFVEEIDGVSVSIRPNPTTNKTIVSWENAEADKLCLYDIAGKLITTQKDLHGQSAELDLSPYANGVYFVRIHWDDGRWSNTYKIVKE